VEQEELAALISQTAALMEQFERRTESADKRLEEITQQLAGLAQRLPHVVKQSADEALQSIPTQVIGQTQGGLASAVSEYQNRWRAAADEVSSASKVLAERITRMERLHRNLIWKTAVVVSTSLAIMLGGAVWLATHYLSLISENQVSAQLMRAYNRADVALCEDGKLCANVDTKGKRYGDQRQYSPVFAR
jgi:uncharacterized phage infection (PIP) family protein YhgE